MAPTRHATLALRATRGGATNAVETGSALALVTSIAGLPDTEIAGADTGTAIRRTDAVAITLAPRFATGFVAEEKTTVREERCAGSFAIAGMR